MVYQMGLRGNKRFVALSLLRSRCERPKSWATANRRGTSTKCPESAPDPHRSHVGDFRDAGRGGAGAATVKSYASITPQSLEPQVALMPGPSP